MNDLRTPNQVKWDKIRAKVIALFDEIANEEASNWQKYSLIAKKLSVTPHYVMKVIKSHNEQSDNQSN